MHVYGKFTVEVGASAADILLKGSFAVGGSAGAAGAGAGAAGAAGAMSVKHAAR